MFKKYYISAGTGIGHSSLTSFDSALIHTGVGNYNLVRVSSILPPNAKKTFSIDLKAGQALHVAYASITSNKRDTIISSAVGIGIPKDSGQVGVIMEYSGYCVKREAESQVESMIKEAMSLRNYQIYDISIESSETQTKDNAYSTAFAVVAMW